MKRMRAIEFRDLTEMSEIVIDPFMEHFGKRERDGGLHVAGRGGLHKAPPGQGFILLSKCFERTPEELAHNVACRMARTRSMGKVVALMDDLFFQMKLAETAKQLGVELKVATNGDALMGLMESNPRLVIVDLNARSHPIQTIEKLRLIRKDIRVVGFLSHVQVDLAAQAQNAGCDEVMPRSAFTQNLASILSVAKD